MFTGAFARNPANDVRIPIFIADYVLMGYGTGAIMAVPGQDERDWEFAEEFDLPIVRIGAAARRLRRHRRTSATATAINSGFLDGLAVAEAKATIIEWLEREGLGAPTVTYKLRDWLFSRQRYWGEPFPIVYDERRRPLALPESMLPVELPELDDFRAARRRPTTSADATPCRSRRSRAPKTGSTSSSTSATARSATSARRTRCRSGPDRAGTTCATSTRRTKTRSSTPRSSGTG